MQAATLTSIFYVSNVTKTFCSFMSQRYSWFYVHNNASGFEHYANRIVLHVCFQNPNYSYSWIENANLRKNSKHMRHLPTFWKALRFYSPFILYSFVTLASYSYEAIIILPHTHLWTRPMERSSAHRVKKQCWDFLQTLCSMYYLRRNNFTRFSILKTFWQS